MTEAPDVVPDDCYLVGVRTFLEFLAAAVASSALATGAAVPVGVEPSAVAPTAALCIWR